MDQENALIQNLEDAGCTADFIKNFMMKWNHGKKTEELRLLEAHRRSLLDTLHQDQKRIDCLDFLVYQLQKADKEKA